MGSEKHENDMIGQRMDLCEEEHERMVPDLAILADLIAGYSGSLIVAKETTRGQMSVYSWCRYVLVAKPG